MRMNKLGKRIIELRHQKVKKRGEEIALLEYKLGGKNKNREGGKGMKLLRTKGMGPT